MYWLLIACLLWGPSFGLVPILQGSYGMNPYMLAVLRMLFAFILFAPLMGLQRIPGKQRLQLILLGALQFGVMYITLFLSYGFMEGYEVALVTILTPIYVSLLDHLLRKGRIRLQPLLCVILAVIGACVIRYARPDLDDRFWVGFGIMQICNLSFAFGQVFYRQLMKPCQRLDDMYSFGWMYLGALAVTLIGWLSLAPVVDTLHHLQQLPLPAWGIVLWLGLIPSGLAFFLFNHWALKVDAGTLAIVNNLKIPIALLIVMLVFQQREIISSWPRFTAGTAIMLLSLWMNQHPLRHKWTE
jgi:drug/metabolite transporter (DMT)-like permease